MLKKVALWISYITEPFLTSFLAFGLVLYSLDVLFSEKIVLGLIALVLGATPPTVVFLYEKRRGKIKDWFITTRIERRDVHLAWVFGSAFISLIFWQLGVPRLLLATTFSLLLLSIVITLATFIWKISVHIVGITFLILILLLVFSSNYLPLVIIIGLVAWTRIYLGHHTLSQVSVASILTILIVYYVFNIFGLATF